MGAIGERKMQELIDRAAADVARGTPQDIASRGLFEACAEVLEGQEDLEHRAEKAETAVDDYEKAVEELRNNVKKLLDEDVGYGDPEPGDILDAYKTLAQEIEELRAGAKTKDARFEEQSARTRDEVKDALRAGHERITNLQQALEAAEARAAGFEKELEATVKERGLIWDELTEAEERIKDLGKQLVTAEARLRELEPAGEASAALIERVRCLESGLGRIVVEAYKLRKGAL